MFESRMRDLMVREGVPLHQAQVAAKRCSEAINDGALTGLGVSSAVALTTAQLQILLSAIVLAPAGAIFAGLRSDACLEIREAALRLYLSPLHGGR